MASLLLLLLLAGADKPKPKIELKASPRLAQLGMPPRASATVMFRLSVKDGGHEDYYCPRVEWEWEDDTRATEESDCPPFAEAQKADHEKSWSRSHVFWEPGEHTIKVHLYKGDRLIKTLDTRVEVTGEAIPSRYRER
jgi:hypothetical protein